MKDDKNPCVLAHIDFEDLESDRCLWVSAVHLPTGEGRQGVRNLILRQIVKHSSGQSD